MNDTQVLKTLAKNVKRLREERKISIQELSDLTKISPKTLNKIEENLYKRVQFDYVIKLAKIFNVSLQNLCE